MRRHTRWYEARSAIVSQNGQMKYPQWNFNLADLTIVWSNRGNTFELAIGSCADISNRARSHAFFETALRLYIWMRRCAGYADHAEDELTGVERGIVQERWKQ